ncbi:hypothetical protein SAMN05216387_104186 [Nitrosovibrio tenuis]|uniref:Uncharacterized protein n=1 Tax=Nitrosovibrio tenuis TaxID=1233 RepID=A0A1H7LWG4_9PROT|nr:hypothetical protein SAMN05216387_104186 [Nitrosovibrio tenuis]
MILSKVTGYLIEEDRSDFIKQAGFWLSALQEHKGPLTQEKEETRRPGENKAPLSHEQHGLDGKALGNFFCRLSGYRPIGVRTGMNFEHAVFCHDA